MAGDWDHSPRHDRSEEFRSALDQHIRKTRQQYNMHAEGLALRHCPICDYYGRFGPFGVPPRFDARCPSCNSLERHRLIWLCMMRQSVLNGAQRLLHFAAEGPLRRVVAPAVGSYETAELRAAANPDHILNIEAIELPDASFDRVICNHVLEHVNDAKALSEMFRILKPGGIAVLTTPVIEGWAVSYENPEVDGQKARTLHFGQHDHVRYFGRDLRDRIRTAGFVLTEFAAVEPDVHRHGLMRGETVFLGHKPEGTA